MPPQGLVLTDRLNDPERTRANESAVDRKKLDAGKRKEIATSVISGRKSGADMARLDNISAPTAVRQPTGVFSVCIQTSKNTTHSIQTPAWITSSSSATAVRSAGRCRLRSGSTPFRGPAVDQPDQHMREREAEKTADLESLADALAAFRQLQRDLDQWERVHLALGLAAVVSGCYGIGAVEAALALTPEIERMPKVKLPTDPNL
jgi:hypothetical protein